MLVPTLYIALVFVQSLFFTFTDSPQTRYIFGTLDTWGAAWGFPGLCMPSGIFSQYVVGSVELLASVLLLAGLLFVLACGVWLAAAAILIMRGDVVAAIVTGSRR